MLVITRVKTSSHEGGSRVPDNDPMSRDVVAVAGSHLKFSNPNWLHVDYVLF